MPKVTPEHRERMRGRILQATLAVVRRKGLSGTTMNDIITESGLSAGAIYGYFPSKDALITSFAAELITGRFDLLDEIRHRSPIAHPIAALVEVISTVPDDMAHDGVVVQLWGLAPVEPELAVLTRGWISEFTQRLSAYTAAWLRQEGRADDDARARAEALAPVLIGLAQGYFVRGALTGETDLATYCDAMLSLAQEVRA